MKKTEHFLFLLVENFSHLAFSCAVEPLRIANLVRRERAKGVQIGALCSAAYILAKAGLLDGIRAAVHWEFHDIFMEEFPLVVLCRNVFVADEKFITASGGTASADLMLHLIERSHGSDLAIAVADQMVYTSAREATVEQRASIQSRYGMRNSYIVEAIRMMADAIEEPVSPSFIAVKIGISTRQLERVFGRYLNCSHGKYSLGVIN